MKDPKVVHIDIVFAEQVFDTKLMIPKYSGLVQVELDKALLALAKHLVSEGFIKQKPYLRKAALDMVTSGFYFVEPQKGRKYEEHDFIF
jgi:hypothetical protein